MIPAKVEKAMPYDLPELNRISVRSKMHWKYPLDWLQNWLDVLRVNRTYLEENHVFKITLDKTIGFCAIVNSNQKFEVTHLWILPEYMGKGYGKILLMESLKEVIKVESEVLVEADPNVEKFYQKMGFETFSKRESFPKGRQLPLMKRIFP